MKQLSSSDRENAKIIIPLCARKSGYSSVCILAYEHDVYALRVTSVIPITDVPCTVMLVFY